LLIAGRLHQRTIGPGSGEDMYLDWALRGWQWFRASGLIGPAAMVNDGLTAACADNGDTAWTYNQGVIAGAARASWTACSVITMQTMQVGTATRPGTRSHLVSHLSAG
jgi:predicted alpha-1,6-mannanase (GH76 family)